MTDLPNPRKIAPLKAAPASEMGENWPVLFSTGNSGEDGQDWCIQTDRVRASELMDCDLPSDAKTDAYSIAAIVNAYRTGKLVLKNAS